VEIIGVASEGRGLPSEGKLSPISWGKGQWKVGILCHSLHRKGLEQKKKKWANRMNGVTNEKKSKKRGYCRRIGERKEREIVPGKGEIRRYGGCMETNRH